MIKFSLTGAMIPRQVRRAFDHRHEERVEAAPGTAILSWRGETRTVRLGNVSPSGAMLLFDEVPHIGERVVLQILDQEAVPGQVRWVRDGRVGVNFTGPRG